MFPFIYQGVDGLNELMVCLKFIVSHKKLKHVGKSSVRKEKKMTDLRTRLSKDLVTNLKAKNSLAVSVLRHTIGTVQSEEKAGKTAVEFNDEQVLAVIAKLVKQRRETAALYVEKNLPDVAAKETAEADFLQVYLPVAVSRERIEQIAAGVVSGREGLTMRDFGAVMKDVMAQAKTEGSVDGKIVSEVVKTFIS